MKKISVERKTLAGEVYQYLYNMIITLKYKPGQMIFESEIANELGMSRTPVREAIHLLASEEFLRIIPQKVFKYSIYPRKKYRNHIALGKVLKLPLLEKLQKSGMEFTRNERV
ncbi:GntR family transcriptional regulator [Bacillus sp. JCM 19041]|uniref:GntR family transcriptional regulator n=1 Tax=Bacillus sp. JCM 19041 TaxID=1460637 RepID=UPI0006D2B801